MHNVDIVLGYPWMTSVGTINLNVENKFLKVQKKKKVTLQYIPLTTQEDPKGVHDAVAIESLEVIPIDISDDESLVAHTIEDIETQEDMADDVHQKLQNKLLQSHRFPKFTKMHLQLKLLLITIHITQ